jgi:hypothetical protein
MLSSDFWKVVKARRSLVIFRSLCGGVNSKLCNATPVKQVIVVFAVARQRIPRLS